MYTTAENSLERRSAQSALYHIAHSLVRMMAPILSFTADEAWQLLSEEGEYSVFEEKWHVIPEYEFDEETKHVWIVIKQIRDRANKTIEEKRSAGLLGSSLQAELDIYASDNWYESLKRLGDELRFVFITSRVTVHKKEGEGVEIEVTPSPHKKCDRCWHYRADVGSHAEHPSICGRCVSNLFGAGEARKYA